MLNFCNSLEKKMTKFLNGIVLLVISLVLFGCVTTSKPTYPTQSYAPVWLQDVLTLDGTKSGQFQGLRFLRRENKRLKPGYEVKTNAKTIVTLAFTTGETTVILKPNTHVKILDSAIELISGQTEYSDNQGELFITTNRQGKKWQKKFRVKTQNVTIAPIGTKWSIKANKQDVSITVVEGSTQLSSNTQSWQPKIVQQHEKSVVRGKNVPVIQPTTVAEITKLIHPITQVERVIVARVPTPKPKPTLSTSIPPPRVEVSIANNINWLKFSDYKNCKPDECSVLKKYTPPEFKETYKAFKEGVMTFKPSAAYTGGDFNNDGIIDFIIAIESILYCGTAGCDTFMLLSHKKKYLNVDFPYSYIFSNKKAIGLNKSNEFVFNARKGCGFWRLDGNKLIHIRNKPCI
jgi:hypothetical protein